MARVRDHDRRGEALAALNALRILRAQRPLCTPWGELEHRTADFSAGICLGNSGVDIGHNRVPEPPDKMTGTIGGKCGIEPIPNRAVLHLV